MQADDTIRIRHMIDAAQAAIRFVDGRSRADLDQDEMLRFALVRAIEIIGEAASQISSSTRETMHQIPWSLIIGTRNRLVHAYFDVNLDILWATAVQALPDLVAQLKTSGQKE